MRSNNHHIIWHLGGFTTSDKSSYQRDKNRTMSDMTKQVVGDRSRYKWLYRLCCITHSSVYYAFLYCVLGWKSLSMSDKAFWMQTKNKNKNAQSNPPTTSRIGLPPKWLGLLQVPPTSQSSHPAWARNSVSFCGFLPIGMEWEMGKYYHIDSDGGFFLWFCHRIEHDPRWPSTHPRYNLAKPHASPAGAIPIQPGDGRPVVVSPCQPCLSDAIADLLLLNLLVFGCSLYALFVKSLS